MLCDSRPPFCSVFHVPRPRRICYYHLVLFHFDLSDFSEADSSISLVEFPAMIDLLVGFYVDIHLCNVFIVSFLSYKGTQLIVLLSFYTFIDNLL